MINIIPKPLKMVSMAGSVIVGAKSKIDASAFPQAAKALEAFLKDIKGDEAVSFKFVADKKIDEEGYELSITNQGIVIKASSEAGAFYAVCSLIQALEGGNTIDCCEIADSPKYKWRGFMMDAARHYWSLDFIRKILDIMASLKMNIFHWHITDDQGWRIEIKKYPELTQHGSIRKGTQLAQVNGGMEEKEYGRGLYYTQEQIKEIIAYAAERHIQVVPEIDMPGHLVAAISCYPELSCEGKPVDVSPKWGVLDTIGCCGNDKFYEFVKDILDEVCDLFPAKYFHIGGDEVPKTKWKTCPKCQAKMKELNLTKENDLQGYFTCFVANYVKAKGKQMIGWNEILDADNLDKDVIVQWWTPSHGRKEALKWIANGGKVILTKHQDVYMDHSYAIRPLKRTYMLQPAGLGIKDDTNVLGVEAPQWVEYIRDEEKYCFNTFPRMMAIAEAGWTPVENRNYEEFSDKIEKKRPYFEGKYSIMMPDKFTYEGKQVGWFMREKKAWVKWSFNPNHELEYFKKKYNK